MKIIDWAVIVCFLFAGFSMYLDVLQRKQMQGEFLKSRYSEILAIATEDATLALLEPEKSEAAEIVREGYARGVNEIEPNLNKALDRFYKTMYINMGIEEDRIAQEGFKVYLPIKVVVGYDGYYVHSWYDVFNKDSGKNEMVEMWFPKKPYTYYDSQNKLVVNFTLENKVKVYNITNGKWEEGLKEDLRVKYPGTLFSDAYFENIRNQTIISGIQKDLEYYTAKYNYVAKQYNLAGYTFNIPYISKDEWLNTIKGVCFIAFLQGLPIGSENYDTFGFGGTRITKRSRYYGNEINGFKYYHTENCLYRLNSGEVFNTRRDAAKKGYHPCPKCNP